MKILKKALVIIEMTIFAIGALIIGCIIFPLIGIFVKGSKQRETFSEIIRKSWAFFVFVMESTKMISIHIDGDLKNIKNKIIVASHPSLIDIVILIGTIPRSLCLAKKELLHNPFMRNIVKSLYIINDVDPEIFKKSAKEVLQEGYNIIIFPTGTRTLPDEKIKIHKGAAQLAIDNDINIIPINIKTDFPFLAKHKNPLNVTLQPVNYYFSRMPEIVIAKFKKEESDHIKLRKHISDKIKDSIN